MRTNLMASKRRTERRSSPFRVTTFRTSSRARAIHNNMSSITSSAVVVDRALHSLGPRKPEWFVVDVSRTGYGTLRLQCVEGGVNEEVVWGVY